MNEEIKIQLPEFYIDNGRQYDKKELITYMEAIGCNSGVMEKCMTVKFWMGKSNNASNVYCTIWIRGISSGTGKAGGGGYCKKSAAFAEALESAGIYCDKEIAGTGMGIVEDVMREIGYEMEFEDVIIITG